MKTKPSPTTERLLKAIRANPRGRYQEWADAAGMSSTSVVGYHLRKLERAGLVRLHPGRARSVELVEEGTLEEWRQMIGEALDAAEYWKEQAMQARRSARAWKASAKGWRAAAGITCDIETGEIRLAESA